MDSPKIRGFSENESGKNVDLDVDSGPPVFVNSALPPSSLPAIAWTSFGIGTVALILSLIIGGYQLWGDNTTVETAGPAGAKGQKGDTGEKGERGTTGINGAEGQKGEVGPSGGDKGEKGEVGTPGAKGAKGEIGTNVADGTVEGYITYWDTGATEWTETKAMIVNSGTGSLTTQSDLTVGSDMFLPAPTVPASAASSGTAGQMSWDADFLYICTAVNTWKRVPVVTW